MVKLSIFNIALQTLTLFRMQIASFPSNKNQINVTSCQDFRKFALKKPVGMSFSIMKQQENLQSGTEM